MLEFEKKVMLAKAEYEFLRELWQNHTVTAVQNNHYYDTDDSELCRQGITCRIREKDGRCTATIKEHQTKWQDCNVENSRSVSNRYDDALFRDMGIYCQGSLETLRSTYLPCIGVSLMLDRNNYLGVEDFEMEIEYDRDHEAEADAERLLTGIVFDLTEHGILQKPAAFWLCASYGKNKAARFFSRKEEILRRTGGGSHEIYTE
ncbi:MAG: CYTH domain-containing protein [Clostridia bacterium]